MPAKVIQTIIGFIVFVILLFCLLFYLALDSLFWTIILTVIVSVVVTVGLVAVGWTFSIVQMNMAEKHRQKAFRDNAAENSAILQQQFKELSAGMAAQRQMSNSQLSLMKLMKQDQSALTGDDLADSFIIDASVFDELD